LPKLAPFQVEQQKKWVGKPAKRPFFTIPLHYRVEVAKSLSTLYEPYFYAMEVFPRIPRQFQQ
jgi:hypothetical protein